MHGKFQRLAGRLDMGSNCWNGMISLFQFWSWGHPPSPSRYRGVDPMYGHRIGSKVSYCARRIGQTGRYWLCPNVSVSFSAAKQTLAVFLEQACAKRPRTARLSFPPSRAPVRICFRLCVLTGLGQRTAG
jgi:hypothetical protein